jgi:hypothetical protein
MLITGIIEYWPLFINKRSGGSGKNTGYGKLLSVMITITIPLFNPH